MRILEEPRTLGRSTRRKPQNRPPKKLIELFAGVGLCSMLMLWGMVSFTPKPIKDTRVPRAPARPGNWDVPTTLIRPFESISDRLPEFMQHYLHKGQKALQREITDIDAVNFIRILEILPDCEEVLSFVLPNTKPREHKTRRRQVQHLMKHWSAWDMALSENPNASHFLVVDGSFELEVAQHWDAPLSTLLNEADTVAPGWEILHLVEMDFVSHKAWECGVRLVEGGGQADEEDYRFMAYAVAVRNSTVSWLQDFRAWKAGTLNAAELAQKWFSRGALDYFLDGFVSFHSTVGLLTPRNPWSLGPPQPAGIGEFWAKRNGLPCPESQRTTHHPRPDSSAPLQLSVSARPDVQAAKSFAAHTAQRCPYYYPGNTDLVSPDKDAPAKGACGAKWDVPGLFVNLYQAVPRRELLEAQFRKLGPAAPIQRVAALNTKHEHVELVHSYAVAYPGRRKKSDPFSSLVEAAVSLSHLTAIERGATQFAGKSQYLVLMEDDLVLETVPKWELSLSELLQRADQEVPDWGIINLGCSNWDLVQAWDQCRLAFHPYATGFQYRKGGPPPIFFGLVLYAVRLGPTLDAFLHPFRAFLKSPSSSTAATLAGALVYSPADWVFYSRLKGYVTSQPLAVPSGDASQILPGRERGHARRARKMREYWAQKPARCSLG